MKTIAVAVLLAASVAGCATNIVDDGTVIQDVTVVSPERSAPLPHASVVIRDGRIAAVGTNIVAGPHAHRIDGRGGFLIPGLIDSHTHPGNAAELDEKAIEQHPELLRAFREQLPRSYLAFGFTTIVDLDLRPGTLAWFNAAPLHPALCHCGRGVRIIGGYQAQRVPKDAAAAAALNVVYQPSSEWPSYLDPKDFTPQRAVDRVVASGGICVKTYVEPGFGGAAHWPVPSAETLAALREETRRRGLVFIVHANGLEPWHAVLNAHADVIAHGLWHWPAKSFLDTTPPREVRDVIDEAARAGIGVQPTMQSIYADESVFDRSLLDDPRLAQSLPRSVMDYLHSDAARRVANASADEYREAIARLMPNTDPARVMSAGPARAMATLRLMNAANVKLLLGSDTPANEGIGNPPGLNGRFELGHWAEAGVPLARILRAATLENAHAFHLDDRGTIETGKRADLLLLRANPLDTITAYDTIETIFLNGNAIDRNSLLP